MLNQNNVNNDPFAAYGGHADASDPFAAYGGKADPLVSSSSPSSGIGDALRSALSGVMQGVGNLGAFSGPLGNLQQQTSPAILPKNPDLLDKVIHGITSYGTQISPALLGAGPEVLGSKLLGMVGSGAVTGAAENIDHPLIGASVGGVLGSVPSVLSGGLYKAGQQLFRTPSFVKQALQDALSGGNKTVSENAQSLASDIRNAFQSQKQNASAIYQPVFDAAGNDNIYSSGIDQKYLATPNSFASSKSDDLHENFIKNPTVNNAHLLQSQLASDARSIKGSDVGSQQAIKSINNSRQNLLSDINNYLTQKDPNLANQYNQAAQNYLENVVPYTTDKSIKNIATGKITNPTNVANIFASPEGDIRKVVNDLPDSSKGKILYSILGKKQSASQLIDNFDKLSDKGLEEYITPEIQNSIESLRNSLLRRNVAGAVTGLGLGAMNPKIREIIGGFF